MTQGETQRWAARRQAMEASRYWVGPTGARGRWRTAPFDSLLAIFHCAIRLTPLFRRGRQNALDLKLVELTLEFADLPQEFDGYRILHVSDPHLDILPPVADAARRLLEGVETDLLALTGDVHGHHRAPIAESVALLAHALGSVRIRDHRVAVLGNHDPAAMANALGHLGFEVLINRSLVLERNGQALRITGLDDVHYFYTDAARAALDATADGFRIVLVHSPEIADHASERGYALYLCGHTHAGQICLPGGKPIFTRLMRCHHAACGLWREGGMIGHTSSGLGVSGSPVRFNTRGSASLITLRRQSAAG